MTSLSRVTIICAAIAGLSLTGGCGDRRTKDSWQGYIRADMIYVAAPVSGRLEDLEAERGKLVAPDDLLFRLSPEPENFQLAGADAGIRGIEAQIRDMQKGARPEDIAVLKDGADRALAAMRLAELDYERIHAMFTNEFASASEHDAAFHNRLEAAAAYQHATDLIVQAMLGERFDRIEAVTEQQSEQASVIDERTWRTAQKEQRSRVNAMVYDTLYREGEWVAAGSPVAVLLAPELIRVRFFVLQPVAAALTIGQSVWFAQTPHGVPDEAVVNYVSPVPEYTPPVIFSRDTSAKQVFMIEAVPLNPGQALHPGLPVEVRIHKPE